MKTKQTILGATAIVVLSVSFVLWHSHVARQHEEAERLRRLTPEFALQQIDSVHNSAELGRVAHFMTPQGRKVLDYILTHRKGPHTGPEPKIGQPQVRDSTCFVTLDDGDFGGYMRFQQSGVWQFDDFIVTKAEGRTVDISFSYAIDHPILVALQNYDWNGLCEAILNGIDIGLRLRGD